LNISKPQQRILHALAQGGRIQHHRDANGRITHVDCLTREGFRLLACDLVLFAQLRQRRLIASREGGAYRISKEGLAAVRAQQNNR
jgi:uncharacterized protein YjhX (UPF0386 family)